MLYGMIVVTTILLFFRLVYLKRQATACTISLLKLGQEKIHPMIIQTIDECLIVVTDPIGTGKTGVVACAIANEIITAFAKEAKIYISPLDFLKKACFHAHRGISEKINANNGGCSIAIIYIYKRQMYYASVGDICIYSFKKELIRLNHLDIYAHKLIRPMLEGKIKESDINLNPLKNEVVAYLGHENLKKINLSEQSYKLKKREKILILTKEVHQTVSPICLEKIMKKRKKSHLIEQNYQQNKQVKKRDESIPNGVLVSNFK